MFFYVGWYSSWISNHTKHIVLFAFIERAYFSLQYCFSSHLHLLASVNVPIFTTLLSLCYATDVNKYEENEVVRKVKSTGENGQIKFLHVVIYRCDN